MEVVGAGGELSAFEAWLLAGYSLDHKTEGSHPYFMKGYSAEGFNWQAFGKIVMAVVILGWFIWQVDASFKPPTNVQNLYPTIEAAKQETIRKMTAEVIPTVEFLPKGAK